MIRRLVGLFILQGLDLTTTWRGLEAGAIESNPVGVGLLGHGFLALAVAKALATVAVAGIAWFLHRDPASRQLARRGLMAGCGLMVAVVGWNAWVIMLHA